MASPFSMVTSHADGLSPASSTEPLCSTSSNTQSSHCPGPHLRHKTGPATLKLRWHSTAQLTTSRSLPARLLGESSFNQRQQRPSEASSRKMHHTSLDSASTVEVLKYGGSGVALSVLGCSRIEMLKLTNYGRLVDIRLLASCSRLISLSLSGCKTLSDVSPLASCPTLASLNLSGCSSLIDISPLACCTQLVALKLRNCRRLADVAPLAHCVCLTALNLSGCSELEDIGPLACTRLVSLDLSRCGGLVDISPLATCARLKVLNLLRCDGVDDVGALAGCVRLKSLLMTLPHWWRANEARR